MPPAVQLHHLMKFALWKLPDWYVRLAKNHHTLFFPGFDFLKHKATNQGENHVIQPSRTYKEFNGTILSKLADTGNHHVEVIWTADGSSVAVVNEGEKLKFYATYSDEVRYFRSVFSPRFFNDVLICFLSLWPKLHLLSPHFLHPMLR